MADCTWIGCVLVAGWLLGAPESYGQTVPDSSPPNDTAGSDSVQSEVLSPMDAVFPVDALRMRPGVHWAQTGLDRRTLALRGFGGVFSGDPLVIVDGRRAGLPALGANLFPLMPIQPVDLRRIEIPRGPEAIRYGPAAHDGAVRFVTKNPLDDPGTAVALAGGQQTFGQAQVRHAAVIGSTFGYEITLHGTRGTDWPLRTDRPTDRHWLEHDVVFDTPSSGQPNQRVDPDTGQLLRADDYWTAGVHGQAVYRLSNETTISARGGYAALTRRMLSEMGALQADALGYSFAQVRVDAGRLRVQGGLNNNEAGNSYLYGTGRPMIDRGVAYDARLRYRFDTPAWATEWTLGADAYWTRPRTEGTLMGRHEEQDAINRYGTYGIARTALTSRLDLTLALRADVDNLSPAVWPAWQANVTYEAAPAHVLHLRYGRSVADPQARTHFLDVNTRRQTLAAPYDLVYRVRGATDRFTFHRYRSHGLATSLIPGAGHFGQALAPSSIPLRPLYETAAAHFEQYLDDPTTRPDPVQALTVAQRQDLARALADVARDLTRRDRTEGALGVPDGVDGFRPVDGPEDVPPLARPVTQMLETGYRGALGSRVQLSARLYAGRTKNTVGPLHVASPLVYVPRLTADLTETLSPIVAAADAPLRTLLDAMGLRPEEAAQLATELVTRTIGEEQPIGVASPDQELLGDAVTEHAALLTYRNVPRVRYAGGELGLRVQATDRVRARGSLSAMYPKTFADEDDARRTPAGRLALNTPAFQAHLGGDVEIAERWTLQVAGHYTADFPVRAGFYVGTVAAAFPLDVGVRYDAQRIVPGLHVQLAVQNVGNQAHRGFVGAPAVGRVARVRMAYTF